jgi:hypothetical protein
MQWRSQFCRRRLTVHPIRRSANARDKPATIAAQRKSAVRSLLIVGAYIDRNSISVSSLLHRYVLIIYLGNGEQAGQACPNCLDHGIPCVTSLSRSHSHRNKYGSPVQHGGSDHLRDPAVSRPVGLLSPNATSVEFSVHPEDNQVAEGNNTPALDSFDEPGERSSILPDDKVRYSWPSIERP